MDLRQEQSQKMVLTQQQMLGLSLLQMNHMELEAYLSEVSLENPVIDLCEPVPSDDAVAEYVEQQQWLRRTEVSIIENDYDDEEEESDPFSRIPADPSFGDTLQDFAVFQLQEKNLPSTRLAAAQFLLESLDENGFLTDDIDELAKATCFSSEDLREALCVIRTLDPAGIGAANVTDALCLQLERLGAPKLAAKIIKEKLPELARHHYEKIARELFVTPSAVKAAADLIRSLDPFPCRGFTSAARAEYIFPDIIIREENGLLQVVFTVDARSYFKVNPFYLDLYQTSDDPDVRKYLAEKLSQARALQRSISQRESTLSRCVRFISVRQADFFREGISALHGLRLSDAADALEMNISTISRAIKGKYLQCAYGVFPLSFFFSGSAKNSNEEKTSVSTVSLKEQLKRIVLSDPDLSDRVLSEKLREAGFSVSRRTVSKYRAQLGLPSSYDRRGQ